MTLNITYWWYFLCATAAVNALAWTVMAASLQRQRGALSAESYILCRRQLLLSAIYVFGCAFRSILPVYDVGRIVLVNSWISSVLVGRTVATVAELSFVTQWALMLHQSAVSTRAGSAKIISLTIVPFIALAELCCWYSVLTTSNLGQVFEAILWDGTALLGVVAMLRLRTSYTGTHRRLLSIWSIAGAAYVFFMCWYDVPMYWTRWISDQAGAHQYLSLAQGLRDIAHRWVVSYRWQDWKGEIAWMSLYFSVAVWSSLSLIYATMREATRTAIRIRTGHSPRSNMAILKGG